MMKCFNSVGGVVLVNLVPTLVEPAYSSVYGGGLQWRMDFVFMILTFGTLTRVLVSDTSLYHFPLQTRISITP